MAATIDPEPTAEERDAILAALAETPDSASAWTQAALREGVEDGEPEA